MQLTILVEHLRTVIETSVVITLLVSLNVLLILSYLSIIPNVVLGHIQVRIISQPLRTLGIVNQPSHITTPRNVNSTQNCLKRRLFPIRGRLR